MGVYIKGMEMPKDCAHCSFQGFGGRMNERILCMLTGTNDYINQQSKFEDCPLIDVPTPHGRLIDADALDIRKREQQAWQDYEHNPDNEYLEGVKDGLHEASKQLSTAMTIIEAEGT